MNGRRKAGNSCEWGAVVVYYGNACAQAVYGNASHAEFVG